MKILMESPNVLVLDEPTNDIDIDTLTVLEDYIDDFRGPAITVSHDRYFLDRICNKVFHLDGKGKITQYTGNYFTYTEEKIKTLNANTVLVANTESLVKESSKANPLKGDKKPRPKTKLSYRESKEYEAIYGEIEKLEGELERICRIRP